MCAVRGVCAHSITIISYYTVHPGTVVRPAALSLSSRVCTHQPVIGTHEIDNRRSGDGRTGDLGRDETSGQTPLPGRTPAQSQTPAPPPVERKAH